MLSIIVSEAARGVNIAKRYPVFFQQLMNDRALLEEFLDSLALLRCTQNKTFYPLPQPPSRDLSFLYTWPQPTCVLVPLDNGQWGMTLTLHAEQLNRRFFPHPLIPMSRRGLGIGTDEDNWFTLIRETLVVEESTCLVILEGTAVDEAEETVRLDVTVVSKQGLKKEKRVWEATLNWGSYEVTVALNERGRATFPQFHLDGVLNETGLAIKEGLVLTVASRNS